MDVDRCICCGSPIPEGRLICPSCEQKEIQTGIALQSINATKKEVQDAYEWLYANIDNLIDMCRKEE